MVSPKVDHSTLDAINSRFFLLPKGIQRQQTTSLLGSGSDLQILNVYLTTDVVELIQRAEEAILESLKPKIKTDRVANLEFNEHNRLVSELSRVRELLKPSD